MRSDTDNNTVARWLRREPLRDEVTESLKELAVKVDAAAVKVILQSATTVPTPTPDPNESDVWAWGQYLNDPSGNQQTGVFGTAAAIEIVRLGNGALSEHCRAARCTLPFAPNDGCSDIARQQRDSAVAKGDTKTTFRVAALVHAWTHIEASANPGPSLESSVAQLQSLRLSEGGWNESPNSANLLSTQFHPTAAALYALSVAGRLDLDVAVQAITPLHLPTAHDPGIALWSMLSLALDGFAATEQAPVQVVDAVHRARKEIRSWIRSANLTKTGFSIEGYDFVSAEPDPGGQGKRYSFMFYMPHCLAALAILRSNELSKGPTARAYALRVIQIYSDRLQKTSLVRPPGRNRDSTVETLWVARLFRAYLDQPRPTTDLGLLVARVGDPVRSLSIWRRLGSVFAIGATTFVAVFAGLFAANTVTNHALSDGLGALISVFASALSSILAAVLIEGQGRR